VVNLPGSPGGVKDGISVLAPILDHVLSQLRGGDHKPGGGL
jgi:molybdopterin biosynthesis enzyme MoaB